MSQSQLHNCAKVFVQRDYSDGTAVKFQLSFPTELDGKIERQTFEHTVHQLNAIYAEAERARCSTYCEGCFACMTVYLIYLCKETQYEKCLKKVAKFIKDQNERLYIPRGLMLIDPIERGLRVVEISILNEQAPGRS